MTLAEFRIAFKNQLSDLYPEEEIQSIFSLLTEAYLGLSRLQAALEGNRVLSQEVSDKYQQALKRLLQYEPIQYIIGHAQFYALTFNVNSEVLIPRPETEELVQWVLDDANDTHLTKILDIGTGSGCIAVALAKNLKAEVSAIDISEKALAIASSNARANEVEIDFQQLDILSSQALPDSYNIIVSNPPYVRHSEKEKMKPNVLEHEPDLALFVENEDPLLFYRKISQLGTRYLSPKGRLYLEINEYLSKEVIQLLKSLGYTEVVPKKDIFGKDRMIRCTWNG